MEKFYLINLIGHFKKCLFNLYNNKTCKSDIRMKNNLNNIKLEKLYVNLQKTLLDTDSFFFILGEKYNDFPTNLDCI